MRIGLIATAFSLAMFAIVGCEQGGSEPATTNMSDIDQYLADNPDHEAQQAAADEAGENEEDDDAGADE